MVYLPVNGFPIETSNVILMTTKGAFGLSGLTVPQAYRFIHASWS
jgi:hypothetical protein